MRYITEEQARDFVKSGVFPRATSTDEIKDLTHAFGRLPYKFNLSLLISDDKKIQENAWLLFKLLLDDKDFATLQGQVNKYRNLLYRLPELRRAAEEAQAALAKAEQQLQAFEYDPEEDKR